MFIMPSMPTTYSWMTLNYTSLSALTGHSALLTTVSSPFTAGWTPTGFVWIQTKPKRSSLVPVLVTVTGVTVPVTKTAKSLGDHRQHAVLWQPWQRMQGSSFSHSGSMSHLSVCVSRWYKDSCNRVGVIPAGLLQLNLLEIPQMTTGFAQHSFTYTPTVLCSTHLEQFTSHHWQLERRCKHVQKDTQKVLLHYLLPVDPCDPRVCDSASLWPTHGALNAA